MTAASSNPAPIRPPTLLHVWTSLHAELLWAYDGVVDPTSASQTSNHEYGYWAWLLRRGSVRVTTGGKSWTAKAGQWIIPPQGVLLQEFSPGSKILSVHFRCQWSSGENLFAGKDGMVFDAAQFPRLERSASKLQRLVQRRFPKIRLLLSMQAADYPVYLRLQQLFFQWLGDFYDAMIGQGRFLSQAGQCDPRLLRATQCFHESPLNKPFPSARLLHDTGLSRVHLDRLFWNQFGVTPREYWDNLRERSAAHILETTDQPVKEVGYHLGFKQASHFSTWFFRRTRTTPKDYRTRARHIRATAAL